MAHWLVQTNGANEEDYRQIIQALKDENASWGNIKLRPFTNNVQGLPHKYREMPVVLLGTVNLSKWGKSKGLKGVWWNDNFNFEIQRNVFKDHMLNFESEIHNFGAIPKFDGERFIRPVDDGKAFTGEIIGSNNLVAWQDRIQYFNGGQLNASTLVQVSPIKSIFREYRFFVVNRVVVTGSMYNEDNKLIRRALDTQDDVVREYAQSMVNIWQPDTVFVIDIAVLNDTGDMKIVEFNNVNASGFYKSDIRSFVRAVDGSVL
jgi:hypothetical protein